MRNNSADSGKNAKRGAVSRPHSLDATDVAIIEALQRNGRESFRRIARAVGVSEATVRARYARLCDESILQVTGVTNPLGLGFASQAMIGVRIAGPPGPVADAIAAWEQTSQSGDRADECQEHVPLGVPHVALGRKEIVGRRAPGHSGPPFDNL